MAGVEQITNQYLYLDDWERQHEARTRQESRMRREDLFDHISQSDHVGVTELAPYVTVIPDLGKPLAVRCDAKFKLTQALYGIVRVGSHGFGLATAYGSDKTTPGASYITQINEDPYAQQTKLIAPLPPEVQVPLGGDSKLVPELTAEGPNFVIRADRKGEIRLKAERLGTLPFQLISATSPVSHREETEYTPLNEVGTWSLPPRFLKRVLKVV